MNNQYFVNPEFIETIKNTLETPKEFSILDSVTNTILRDYIFEYCEALIEKNTPFSFLILDVDNFRTINDKKGHKMGDILLRQFADRLKNAIGDEGYVSRYGGDEFIVVLPNYATYDSVYKFLASNMFGEGAPMRDNYNIDGDDVFITATVGASSFPYDATNIDELFLKADKALYKGKLKGRNCFVIYVDSLHRDLKIGRSSRNELHQMYWDIAKIIDETSDFKQTMKLLDDYLCEQLRISDFIYIPEDTKNKELLDGLLGRFDDFSATSIEKLKDEPDVYNLFNQKGVQSFVLHKNSIKGGKGGYYAFLDNKVQRIWQDEDLALLLYTIRCLNH